MHCVKQEGIEKHLCVIGMIWREIKPRFPEPLANSQLTRSMCIHNLKKKHIRKQNSRKYEGLKRIIN